MPGSFAEQLRQHAFKKRLSAALEDFVCSLQAGAAGFGIVGRCFGIAEDQCSRAIAKSAPEFKDRVSANGNADQRRAINTDRIHYQGDVGSVLLHDRWAITE